MTTAAAAVPPRFDGLRALFVNAALKRSPEPSHTDGPARVSTRLMREHGVEVEEIRAIDHDIATGVWPDMTEHGAESDVWPALFEKVMGADILVLPSHRRPTRDGLDPPARARHTSTLGRVDRTTTSPTATSPS